MRNTVLVVLLVGILGGIGWWWTIGGTTSEDLGTSEPRIHSYPYQVETTVGMVKDIVTQVAGERGDVMGIIGEGVDPHLYKPTRGDVTRLHAADIVMYCGLMLEGKMADMLVKVARKGKAVYAVTEEVDESFLLQPAGFDGHYDPHLWMDVSAWGEAVQAVARALSEFDPDHAADYAANAKTYRQELGRLHTYVTEVIASIPDDSRVLITAHDAFNYFGRAYGIEVMGIQGLSTESEAGLEDINQLVDVIVERKVNAIFVESSVAEKNVKALIEGAKARGQDVVIGGQLFSDAMGTPDTYEGTYIGMIDHNATIVARALGGEAPAGGMQGKLTRKGGSDGE